MRDACAAEKIRGFRKKKGAISGKSYREVGQLSIVDEQMGMGRFA